MKHNKRWICGLMAATMAVAVLPLGAVNAVELGDLDGDGVLTGHDTAMLSAAACGELVLTEEQNAVADVNGDGNVDMADAEMLFEQQTYLLGDVTMQGKERTEMDDVMALLVHYAAASAGNAEDWTAVQTNLADVDLDGDITILDACILLSGFARQSVGLNCYGDNVQYHYEITKMDYNIPTK